MVVLTSNPALLQHLGGCVGVRLVQVGEEDVFAGADAAGDGLADRAGADDDGDFAHALSASPSAAEGSSRSVTRWAWGPTTEPTIAGP